jgi:hypothetical protein
MATLDANALKSDPKGLRFLRDVLTRSVGPHPVSRSQAIRYIKRLDAKTGPEEGRVA